MKKKIFQIFLLSAVLVMTNLPNAISCFAEENTEINEITNYVSPDTYVYKTSDLRRISSSTHKDLLTLFREETESFSEYIDVSDYHLFTNEIQDFYISLVLSSPRSYYLIANSGFYDFAYSYSESTGKVTGIIPYYAMYSDFIYNDKKEIMHPALNYLKPEIKANQKLFDETIEKAQETAEKATDDFGKLVAYHNFIIENYDYDFEDLAREENERQSNNIIQLIKTGKSLCQSYAMMFNYLAMEDGIDTAFITSKKDNKDYHVWNAVYLYSKENKNIGNWYYIDVTWDDVGNTYQGTPTMQYFLQSEKQFEKTHKRDEEHVYYQGIEGTGTEYENIDWKNAITPLIERNGKFYYLIYSMTNTHAISLREYVPGQEKWTEIYSYAPDWEQFHGSPTLDLINGKLYLDISDHNIVYNFKTGKATEIST